jgi:hypothetical protein
MGIRRRGRKPTKPSAMYFNPAVEEAILEYNHEDTTYSRKQQLFKVIYPALDKLAENVINNMKKYEVYQESYETVKTDLVCFLTTKLGGFKQAKGLGFSYFNRCTINWVLGYRNKVNNNRVIGLNPEILDNRNLQEEIFINDRAEDLNDFLAKWSEWGLDNLDIIFDNRKHQAIGNAIFNLFKNRDSIDIYNKKAMYILIREQVECKTMYITEVLKIMSPLFESMFQTYRKTAVFEDCIYETTVQT